MQTKWFKDCKTPEEKQKRKDLISNSGLVLDILAKICYNSISEMETSSFNYSNPNWAFEQAHRNGKVEALKEILKMCDLEGTIDHNG